MVTHPCFVISPIGDPDSPTREHGDAVLECIVEPALKALDLRPLRADQIAEPGKITDQMIEAGEFVCLAGLSLGSWANSESFGSLERALERGVKVRMLLVDSEHPMLDNLINPRLALQSAAKIREQIEGTCPRFRDLSDRFRNAEIRVLKQGMLTSALLVTDKVALVVQYLYSLESGNSPLFRYPRATTLHGVALGEFNSLWEANAG